MNVAILSLDFDSSALVTFTLLLYSQQQTSHNKMFVVHVVDTGLIPSYEINKGP